MKALTPATARVLAKLCLGREIMSHEADSIRVMVTDARCPPESHVSGHSRRGKRLAALRFDVMGALMALPDNGDLVEAVRCRQKEAADL